MPPEEEPTTSAADKRVLIVDDDLSSLEYLGSVVKREGFQLETAKDGQEGLKKVKDYKPDLVLLDLKLPKVQGLEILRLLQADDSAGLPIIVITGQYADRQTQQMLKQEPNVKGYYVKPVNATLLALNLHCLLKTKPVTKQQPADW